MLHNPSLSMAAWLRGPALDTVRTQRGDTETGNQRSRSRSQYQSQSPQNRLQDIKIRFLRQRLSFPQSRKWKNENILHFSVALYSDNLEVSAGYQTERVPPWQCGCRGLRVTAGPGLVMAAVAMWPVFASLPAAEERELSTEQWGVRASVSLTHWLTVPSCDMRRLEAETSGRLSQWQGGLSPHQVTSKRGLQPPVPSAETQDGDLKWSRDTCRDRLIDWKKDKKPWLATRVKSGLKSLARLVSVTPDIVPGDGSSTESPMIVASTLPHTSYCRACLVLQNMR